MLLRMLLPKLRMHAYPAQGCKPSRPQSSPVAHAPAGVRTAFQPLLVASAMHLVQPQRLSHPLPEGATGRGDANSALAQLRQYGRGRVRHGCYVTAKAARASRRPGGPAVHGSANPNLLVCTCIPAPAPTWRHTTVAAALEKPSSQTVPQTPLCCTSSRPAVLFAGLALLTSRTEAAQHQVAVAVRVIATAASTPCSFGPLLSCSWLAKQPGTGWWRPCSLLAGSGTTGRSVGTSSVGATAYCSSKGHACSFLTTSGCVPMAHAAVAAISGGTSSQQCHAAAAVEQSPNELKCLT